MRYRRATDDDILVLARMNRDLIRDEGHRNPMSEAELGERMRGWLAAEFEAVLFEDYTGAAGYALFRIDPEHVYLRQFFVEPARRRQGIGRAAIEHLSRHFWSGNCRVRIEVLSGNAPAIAFWRAAGFVDYCISMERSL
jgi:GNAT superfamily N-acetyltransferase